MYQSNPMKYAISDSQQKLLDKILQYFYDNLVHPQPHNVHITDEYGIQQIRHLFKIEKGKAQDIWKLFKHYYLHSCEKKSAYYLSHECVERVAEIQDNIPIDKDFQEKLVNYLYEQYLNTPKNPKVMRKQILEDFNVSTVKIDLNLYILESCGWVKTYSAEDVDNQNYRSVELNELRF